jgi:hypothetical protein
MQLMLRPEVKFKRGCGYRKVGGLYLVGGGLTGSCDRLPVVIPACSCCGEKPRFNRGIAPIDPYKLFGWHEPMDLCTCFVNRKRDGACPICQPDAQQPVDLISDRVELDIMEVFEIPEEMRPKRKMSMAEEKYYIMWIGSEHYSPTSFVAEVIEHGASKRIPHVPTGFEVGTDWVFCAMKGMVNDLLRIQTHSHRIHHERVGRNR